MVQSPVEHLYSLLHHFFHRSFFLIHIRFDHPAGPGCVFKVGEEVDAPGFYLLYFRYKVEDRSSFEIKYSLTARFTEFEIVHQRCTRF
jgi:hypothetical protein